MLRSFPTRSALPRLATLVSLAALMAACAMPPKPVTMSEVVAASAVVEAIDPVTRRVRLKVPDGRSLMVQAGPAVQNFGQVKVGDRVTVKYTEAVAAEVVRPGTGVTTTTPVETVTRAPAGQRPGVTDSVSLKGVVKVVSVDTVNNIVEIIGLDGAHRKVRVVDSRAQEFMRGLKPGNEVQLTFTEAIAVSVEPAR